MKDKKEIALDFEIELEVDIIGNQNNLTKEQEQAISDFIRLDREKQAAILAKKLKNKP